MKKNIQPKNIQDAKLKLIELYKKKLQLILEKNSNQNFKKTHIIKKYRKDLARILTYIKQESES